MTPARRCTDLVAPSEFGPFDALADDAHAHYVDGFSTKAAEVAWSHLALTRAAGDVTTSRYLRYIAAIALQDVGRHGEAVAEASVLADELGDDLEPDTVELLSELLRRPKRADAR